MGKCLVVLGMHRSGTSALTGALQQLGVALGGRLVPPAPDNPKGFFEHAVALEIHSRILRSLGSHYDDFSPLPEGWQNRPDVLEKGQEISRIVAEDFEKEALSGIKDPRLCRLFPLWASALRESGVEPCVVLCVRNPVAVAESLHGREGFSLNKGLLIWLCYMIEAERHSRGTRRAVVSYDALLEDARGTLDRVASVHGIAWPSGSSARLDEFLDKGLRHHDGLRGDRAGDLDPRLLSLAERVSASVGALASPGAADEPMLDALGREWDELVPAYKGWRQSWDTFVERRVAERTAALQLEAERARAELEHFKSEMRASLVYRTRLAFLRAFPLESTRHRIVHGVANTVMSPFLDPPRS